MEKNNRKAVIGLLPLYIKLYDDVASDKRPRIDAFYKRIADELEKRSLSVITVPVCRIREEFDEAVRIFEKGGADAIVTLHLAYSPSLESSDVLAKTRLPLIVCNTTPTFSYGPDQDPDELMYNHGIHGVQDMCNLLLRNRKPFILEAGHWEKSGILDRVAMHVRAARMCSSLRTARVGLIGESFKGMGDFYVSPRELKSSVGAEVVNFDAKDFLKMLNSVTESEIAVEVAANESLFELKGKIDSDVHRKTVRTGLAVRKWIESKKLDAFTFNFLDITRAKGFDTVPFLEASRQMASGVGYGGEGDVLTAALVGTLLQENADTSFSEMFCPDWKNGTVFLSHMGEMNYRLVDGRASLMHKEYGYSDTGEPVYVCGRFRPGDFVLVNLAPVARATG